MKSRFSEILKACRKNSGFTQQQISMLTGINKISISNWEIGKFVPNIVDYEKILNVYGLTLMIGKLEDKK